MRYILNDSGYIETISFNYMVECNNKLCTEYTGSVPTGYETLAEWSENANINAYKIVNGNLIYDSEEDTRLQSLWDSQSNSQTATSDTLPIGSIFEYDGNEVPDGYEEVANKKIIQLYAGIATKGIFTLSDNVSNYDFIMVFATENAYDHRKICNIYKHQLESAYVQYLQLNPTVWESNFKIYGTTVDTTNCSYIGTSNYHIYGIYGVKL